MEHRAERKTSRREWLLYMIFLPLLFTIILTVVLLQISGYNVAGQLLKWGSAIPSTAKVMPSFNEADKAQSEQAEIALTEQLQTLREEQTAQLRDYETDVKEKNEQIETLTTENEQLRLQLQEAREQQLQEQDVAQLYASMSPSKAAPIMEKMPIEQTVKILSLLKKDEQSLILARLNPELAANVTAKLLNGE